MQEAGVHLRDACWDIKKSLTGFSVSFFCLATTYVVVAHWARTTKNKWKERRGKHRVENEEILPIKSSHHNVGYSCDPPPNDAHHPLYADSDISLGEATPRVDGSHDQAQVVEGLNCDSIETAVTKLSLSDVHIDSHDEVYFQEVDDSYSWFLCCAQWRIEQFVSYQIESKGCEVC